MRFFSYLKLRFIVSSLLVVVWFASVARTSHTIVFYNVENIFDTINDPHTRDNDFLPDGRYRWYDDRYEKKLENIAYVIGDIAETTGEMATIIALCEVENREVVEQLAAEPRIATANYGVVHYDSPDFRGIDCALLYRPDRFKIEGSAAYRLTIEGEPHYRSRDLLTAWGTIDGEQLFILVGHWSSRLGGVRKSEHKRVAAAQQMRRVIDSVATLRPKSRFIAMGDFNDNPDDESILTHLRAKGSVEQMGAGDLFNPFYAHHISKRGSQVYRDLWSMTDNIAVSRSLVDGKGSGLKLQPSADDSSIYGTIFSPDYLIERDGRYRDYPRRSYRSGIYLGGYSDHLPIYITL